MREGCNFEQSTVTLPTYVKVQFFYVSLVAAKRVALIICGFSTAVVFLLNGEASARLKHARAWSLTTILYRKVHFPTFSWLGWGGWGKG